MDQLLKTAAEASGVTDMASDDRLLDCGELEQERGITITSKVTRLEYNGVTINCVDTPGHADFAGEVDRILSMVDGCILVVDAAEGPQTQTKYVLSRAIELQKQPLVILNKCDRPNAMSKIDSGETEDALLDLMNALGASPEQLDHVTLYASARQGWATDDPLVVLEMMENEEIETGDMTQLLDVICKEIPAPQVADMAEDNEDNKFSLAAVTVGMDSYLGRTCTGRIASGSVDIGDEVVVVKPGCSEAESSVESAKVSGIFVYKGIDRTPFQGKASTGDIITLAGVPAGIAVGDTLTGATNPVDEALETPPLAPPTLSMDFGANNGALAGREGQKVASSQIRQRLEAETDNNVTLQVEASDNEKTVVYARGELQLGILVEQMRREGFELVISPPKILTSKCPDTGTLMEPFEQVTVDVDPEYSGTVVSALTGDRKGILLEMKEDDAAGKTRLMLEVPSRGLLGFASEIATSTKGSAVVTHLFLENRQHVGSLGVSLSKSKLVSNAQGKATAHALSTLSARGVLFIEPGDEVYSGMVVGENSKTADPDMEVNPTKAKETSNMRTQAKDTKLALAPPKRRSVEELIGYMAEDEVIEVTPRNVRLRKLILDSGARERAARTKAKQLRASGR